MPAFSKVLIANRGEIAVRVARACSDAGLKSVAVYAESDRDAMHVRFADEAYSLDGRSAAETYLDIDKLLAIARRAGADAVHPGYGFLAESPEFARAVEDAGIVWIGPDASVVAALGDKTSARRIALAAGAPLATGTPGPVAGADEALAFAKEHGLPIAIKAAHGGGGRGLKVARTLAEVPEAFESAVREATAAFGRGECFVEKYLERPRHVETQCLADSHGNVAVLSTRDCSLQRRHQKLVEEAPAPCLTAEQEAEIARASRAILLEAGYTGAGTCEFLLAPDGALAFLEVNTRLQVEHTVTEEVTGFDLVREQFRIAAGEELGYETVPVRGHAIEFRINGEDPARGFLPAPGTIGRLSWPAGPGVRVDAGVQAGDTVSENFDSLLAKIVVWGPTRDAAIARAKRALAETEIEGVSTVLPFHRAVLGHADFAGPILRAHTGWIESDFADRLADLAPSAPAASEPVPQLERVAVEVGGKRLEVVLPAGLTLARAGRSDSPTRAARPRAARAPSVSGADVVAPMQGTVVKVSVADGDRVSEGDQVAVLEAMKMEQPLLAHRGGVVRALAAELGASIPAGHVVCRIE